MKIIQTSFFRAFAAILVGALLIQYRQETVTWLTIAIGVIFFLSGLISCIVYYGSRRVSNPDMMVNEQGKDISNDRPSFPIAGVGSLFLGIALALAPNLVVNFTLLIIGSNSYFRSFRAVFCLGKRSKTGQSGCYFLADAMLGVHHRTNCHSSSSLANRNTSFRFGLGYDSLWSD